MVKSFFTFKEGGGCSAIYYSRTKLHFKVIICEHLRILPIWKKVEHEQQGNSDSITPLMLQVLFQDFSVLTTETNDFKRKSRLLLITFRQDLINGLRIAIHDPFSLYCGTLSCFS